MRPENISRFRKVKYLKILSEDDFRDKAIRPLFLRMGFSDGRDLCGPYEHGKDAVFIETDRLGFEFLLAVQTKKGNLNLASKASANIEEAITQLNTALKSSIVLLKDKTRVTPNRAILCASGNINEHARTHILTTLANPNIQFLDVDDIIPLIDKHIPELWLGIDTDLLPYLRVLQDEILGDQTTNDSTQDGVLTGAADDNIFVGLKLYRNIKKFKKIRGAVQEIPELEEFPLVAIKAKRINKVLILGEGGSGKSTGLLRIALELARSAEQTARKSKIPVLIKAVELQRAKPKDLIEFCDVHTKNLCGSSKSTFTIDDLKDGNLVIMIDALDEVTESNRSYLGKLMSEFSTQYPKCQIIATSRPYRFTQELEELKSFEAFHVSPISWKQTAKIFNTVAKNRKVPRPQSQELLRRIEKIHGIELNPLLVTVLASSTDFSKHDIPANITELFKKFTELMLGRWDERKGLKHQYQAPLKDFVITKIALHLHVRNETSISRRHAEEIATTEMTKVGHEAVTSILLTEIFDRSGLFRVLGEEIEFKHHLLQEFFAGRAIDSREFVYKVLPDEWWKRALVFYFGEHPDNIETLASAVKVLEKEGTAHKLQATTTIGLALQACYLSPVDEKLSVWKWVVSSLVSSEKGEIEAFDPDNTRPLLDFVSYYLYARDSVALSNIKQNCESIIEWADNGSSSDNEENNRKQFWLVVSLIETGDICEAERVLSKCNLTNGYLLTAIHLGCFLTSRIRPALETEKKKAGEICLMLSKKIAPFRDQLMREVKSTLLEAKQGKIEVIDDEEPSVIV